MLKSTREDYLKHIFLLQRDGDWVPVRRLAESLSLAHITVLQGVQRLAEEGFVEYRPYQGVRLREAGRQVALETLRHHRLIEAVLHDLLGVPWELVHEVAEHWEHGLTEEVEAILAARLGHATRDPHGAPIPDAELRIPEERGHPLAGAEKGWYRIVAISDREPRLLVYAAEHDLRPGALIHVEPDHPVPGMLQLRHPDGRVVPMPRESAAQIFVEKAEGPPAAGQNPRA